MLRRINYIITNITNILKKRCYYKIYLSSIDYSIYIMIFFNNQLHDVYINIYIYLICLL